MAVELKVTKGHAKVDIAGDCTVAQAAELKEALVAAFAGTHKVTLNFAEVISTDVSVLQLLCAAHRNAQAVGVEMELSTISETMVSTVKELGFTRHMPCVYNSSGLCMFCQPGKGTCSG